MMITVVSSLIATYLRLVAWTSRITWIRRYIRDDLESKKQGFIYAFWHGRQGFLPYLHQNDRIRPLISRSKDGEIIAQVCEQFGLEPVRGSSSRGATEATLELIDVVKRGDRIGITPDGPRGPLRRVQAGALFLAQKTGLPIVPVSYGARRAWVFGSWDEFLVPQPFNRISMVYGMPIKIEANDSLETAAQALQAALDTVTREADEAVRT